MNKFKHILVVFLSIAFSSWGQVNFEVKVSKNNLGLNERLRVDFTLDKSGDNFRPPAFSNFRVISGPMQSVSNVFVNGKRSYSMSYSYFLSPLKKESLTLSKPKSRLKEKPLKQRLLPSLSQTLLKCRETPMTPVM